MAVRYWSRIPGKFMMKDGTVADHVKIEFTGTVREWYETLIEVIYDVCHDLAGEESIDSAHKSVIVHPDVETILQCSVLYKPTICGECKRPLYSGGIIKVGGDIKIVSDKSCARNKIEVMFNGKSGTVVVVDIEET